MASAVAVFAIINSSNTHLVGAPSRSLCRAPLPTLLTLNPVFSLSSCHSLAVHNDIPHGAAPVLDYDFR